MAINLIQLTNSPYQQHKTVVEGVTLLIELKANSRTESFFCTTRLVDGTVILAGKELAAKRLVPFNSNSTFLAGVLLVQTAPYSFPNIADGCALAVVT